MKRIFPVLLALFCVIPAAAQEARVLVAPDSARLYIDGTSNRSDWTV